MSGNSRVRQIHRWLSIAFTAAATANLVALALNSQTVWIGLLALGPLVLLMRTGLYLLALPYAVERRRGARAPAPH